MPENNSLLSFHRPAGVRLPQQLQDPHGGRRPPRPPHQPADGGGPVPPRLRLLLFPRGGGARRHPGGLGGALRRQARGGRQEEGAGEGECINKYLLFGTVGVSFNKRFVSFHCMILENIYWVIDNYLVLSYAFFRNRSVLARLRTKSFSPSPCDSFFLKKNLHLSSNRFRASPAGSPSTPPPPGTGSGRWRRERTITRKRSGGRWRWRCNKKIGKKDSSSILIIYIFLLRDVSV